MSPSSTRATPNGTGSSAATSATARGSAHNAATAWWSASALLFRRPGDRGGGDQRVHCQLPRRLGATPGSGHTAGPGSSPPRALPSRPRPRDSRPTRDPPAIRDTRATQDPRATEPEPAWCRARGWGWLRNPWWTPVWARLWAPGGQVARWARPAAGVAWPATRTAPRSAPPPGGGAPAPDASPRRAEPGQRDRESSGSPPGSVARSIQRHVTVELQPCDVL